MTFSLQFKCVCNLIKIYLIAHCWYWGSFFNTNITKFWIVTVLTFRCTSKPRTKRHPASHLHHQQFIAPLRPPFFFCKQKPNVWTHKFVPTAIYRGSVFMTILGTFMVLRYNFFFRYPWPWRFYDFTAASFLSKLSSGRFCDNWQ